MKIKNLSSSVLSHLRGGFVRFAPFNILAVIWVASLIWGNHVPSREDAAHRIPVSFAAGACWGMLFALTVRLAVERRACRAALTHALPAITGATMAALGAWFWYHVPQTDVGYSFWEMVYFGSAVSVASFAVAQLFGKRNAWTVFGRVLLAAVFVGLVSCAVFLGSMLCIAAYDGLIAKVSRTVWGDMAILIWCFLAPVFMAAMLPKDNEPTEHPKAFTVLFWFLVPIGMALLAILYAYIAKIVFAWSMPSGTMNWFASCAVGGYLFLWLSLRCSRVRFFAFLARWGWVVLLPVVATQIVGIVIRYNAYGLTAPRMAGMATLAIGIYALALAALDRSARSAFIVLAVAGLVLSVSPFNILDVPIMQQTARLRAALERAECFAGSGFSVPEKPNIAEKDAKIIDGAWRYLTERGQTFFRYTRECDGADSFRPRQGVWNRNTFTRDISETVRKLSGQKRPDLPKMLKINSAKFTERRRGLPDSKTTNYFSLGHDSGTVDITGYTKFENVYPIFGYEGNKYFVALSQTNPTNRIDVTVHVKKLLGNSGAAADTADGNYHSYTLRAEDAVWKLAPDLAFVVTSLTLYHPPEEQRMGHCLYGYILRK